MSDEVPEVQGEGGDRDTSLAADCDRCCGLCCVASAFAQSPEFAFDKDAGKACSHLSKGFRCGVHDTLRVLGLSGCIAFDCYGAGQKVTQTTFGGTDWRGDPEVAEQMFEVFSTMRQLHTLLMHLDQALEFAAAQPMHEELRRSYQKIEEMTLSSADQLEGLDVSPLKNDVHLLLLRASELVRGQASFL